jgi:hypothetical protein
VDSRPFAGNPPFADSPFAGNQVVQGILQRIVFFPKLSPPKPSPC